MNIDGSLSVMSWNINGGILDKLPVREKLCVLTTCQSELFEMCDCYLTVTVDNMVIVNLYLPTNYRDEASERKFAIACRKVAKLLKKIEKMNRKCILIGDFNCDLLENSSARAETFLSILPTGYSIVPKDRLFVYFNFWKHF